MNRRIAGLWVLALMLSGCGLFTRDTTEPPAALPEIEPTQSLRTLWDRATGSGLGRYYLQLHPFLHEGVIYVAHGDGNVGAHPADGDRARWSIELREPITGGVNGGEGIVVVGTANGDAVALSIEDGHEVWRHRLSSEVMAVSAVERGLLVARTNDGRLHALDAQTGEPRWLAGRTTPALSLRGVSEPLMLPGRVLAGFDNGRLAMFGTGRGNVLWETALATPAGRSELERMVDLDGQMVVAEGAIFAVAYQGRAAALSLSDGRIFWARDFSSYRGLAYAGGQLFITDAFGHIWALDAANGATLWQQNGLRLRGVTAPAVIGEHVVVADFEGYLHWLSRDDGSFAARVRTDPDGVNTRPVVRDQVVYVLGRGGRLSAVAIDDRPPRRWLGSRD